MKYCILSINDDRKEYKNRIRERVSLPEVDIPAFNAHENDPADELAARGLQLSRGWRPKRGELGIWLSTINVWQYCIETGDTVVVFEDDAIPDPDFDHIFNGILYSLPASFDFVALWVPDNQRQDYFYNVKFNSDGLPTSNRGSVPEERSVFRTDYPEMAKVYQGYGGVCVMFTPAGSQKFMNLIKEQGVWSTSDCFFFLAAHAGRVEGYTPHPYAKMPVHYDWAAATTVQNTELI